MRRMAFTCCVLFFSASAASAGNVATYTLAGGDTLAISEEEGGSYWSQYTVTQTHRGDKGAEPVSLKMEARDDDTGKITTGDGAAFAGIDMPAFDPKTGILRTSQKDGYVAIYSYTYLLKNHVFRLQKEEVTNFTDCDDSTGQCKHSKENIVFDVNGAHAKTY